MKRRVRGSIGVSSFVLLAVALPAAGQTPTGIMDRRGNPIVAPDSAVAIELRAMPGTRLDLETALALANDQSTEARDAQAALAAAEAIVRREKGAFDPEIYADAIYREMDLPTATPFAGAAVLETEDVLTNVGIEKRFSTGTRIVANLGTTKLGTNSAFAALDPQYDARGSIDVVQPLLKGFGASARGELSAAEHELVAARAHYDGTLASVRSQVERVYWELYAAERDYAVERVVRDGAAALRESAERRGQAGLIGPNQVANARVFLAEREGALLDGEERLGFVSDRLATIIGQRPDPGADRFRTTVAEPPRAFELVSADSLVALALRTNYTLLVLDNAIEAERERERAAARDALPILDLVGSIGGAGLSGDPQTVVFGPDTLRTDIDGGWGDSWSQVFQGDFPTWSAGVVFRLPIGRRSGTGERDRQRAVVERAEQSLIAAERSLEEVVRDQQRALENAAERLRFAQEGVAAAFDQVRIGRLEFENGRTTAFELVRLGSDLAEAQRRYSRALVRAATAVAELRELTAGAYPALTQP